MDFNIDSTPVTFLVAVIVGLVVGGVLAALRGLLVKWLTAAIEEAVAVLYGQLVGTRPARRFTLSRYRKRLDRKSVV